MNKHVGKIVLGLMLSVSLFFSIAQAEEIKENDQTERKKLEILQAALDGKIEIIKKYIDDGGDLEISSELHYYRGTIISSAIIGEHLDIVKLLVENGANLNYEQPSGVRPLNTAILVHKLGGKADIANYLREKGAEIGDTKKKQKSNRFLNREMIKNMDEPIGSSSNKSEDKKN